MLPDNVPLLSGNLLGETGNHSLTNHAVGFGKSGDASGVPFFKR